MRLSFKLLVLAAVVQVHATPEPGITPAPRALQERGLFDDWCIFGIGPGCNKSTSTSSKPSPTVNTPSVPAPTSSTSPSTAPPVEPSSVSPSAAASPSVGLSGGATPSTSGASASPASTSAASAAPTVSQNGTAVPSLSGSVNASATASPTVAPLAGLAGSASAPTTGKFFSIPLPTPIPLLKIPPLGVFFSYPQPPIPAQTVSADPAIFTASGADAASINQGPTTRTYDFTLGYSAGSPDGFVRSMMTINNQFPGPLIEANQGDRLVINVHNTLSIPASIHWHGMRQRGSNFMDGAPGIHQCPISPGESFTYEFDLSDEMGTFWYHSHYGNTMADGLYGGLIVHAKDDPLKKGQDYDDERILYLGDWMDDQSEVINDNIANLFHGYRGLPIVLQPDAILINGIGQVDCTWTQKGVPCHLNNPAEVKGGAGSRIRFRIINAASHAMIRFSIDGHVLKVVEADDTPIQPVYVNELPIATAQRYSIVVELNQGQTGDSFWMRARAATFCMNPLSTVAGFGILRYTDGSGNGASNGVPPNKPWGNLENPNLSVCRDLDATKNLVPLIPEDAPAATETSLFNSLFGVFIDRKNLTPYIGFGMNGVEYKNYINNPLFSQIQAGKTLNGFNVASVTFKSQGVADIILNVLDPPPLSHPFHLHGRPFYIVGRGTGIMTRLLLIFHKLNTKNPLRRDVLTIPGFSWAVIRVKLDDPGVWPLHCHIGWHLSVGKLAAVVVRPDEIKKQQPPESWKALCAGTNINEIGPARREVDNWMPPQARGSHWLEARHGVPEDPEEHAKWKLKVEEAQRTFANTTAHAELVKEQIPLWNAWIEEHLSALKARDLEERAQEIKG